MFYVEQKMFLPESVIILFHSRTKTELLYKSGLSRHVPETYGHTLSNARLCTKYCWRGGRRILLLLS